jgi:hypothetical protein
MTEKTAPSKKNWFIRHKVASVILVLIVLAVIGSASSSKSNSTGSSSGTSSSKASTSSATPKIGQPASDGKFTFVVNKFTCGIPTVGTNPYAQATAQGQYCDLNLTIKNTGTESQTISDSDQFLFNAAGSKYTADTSADIDAAPSTSTDIWLNNINPGNSVTGDIYFDVPKGTTPVTAELHDSAFSNGVKVSLQ